jgi:hypothetical protein
MLHAMNGRQFNLAAKTIRAFFSEKQIEVSHAEALTLVSRLTGHASYEAAKASLEGTAKGVASEVCTWRQLAHAIGTLDDEQLDMPAHVTEGCDENGNATFTRARQLLLANDVSIAAGACAFKENHPLLLVDEFDAVADSEDGARIAMQFEVATHEPGAIAIRKMRDLGLQDAILWLNRNYLINLSLGELVAYSESNKGFWNVDFGWVYDKASATGYSAGTEAFSFTGAEDLELVPYAQAVDVDPDAAEELGEKYHGPAISRYRWLAHFESMWKEVLEKAQPTLNATAKLLEAQGFTIKQGELPHYTMQGKLWALALYSSHGYHGGDLVIALTDGFKQGGFAAACLELMFLDHSGQVRRLNPKTEDDVLFTTEVSLLCDELDCFPPEKLAETMTHYSSVKPDTGPIVKP